MPGTDWARVALLLARGLRTGAALRQQLRTAAGCDALLEAVERDRQERARERLRAFAEGVDAYAGGEAEEERAPEGYCSFFEPEVGEPPRGEVLDAVSTDGGRTWEIPGT